jgi:hypothetical protein
MVLASTRSGFCDVSICPCATPEDLKTIIYEVVSSIDNLGRVEKKKKEEGELSSSLGSSSDLER